MMRGRSVILSYLYILRIGLTLALTLALARCAAPPKPPPVVSLSVTGSADQNPDVGGAPAPVAVRLIELTATARFERADVFALIDHEKQTLGSDEAGSQEFVLLPSETRTLTIEPNPAVRAIGVAVLYRDIDHARWRAVAPIAGSGPTVLQAGIGKLSVTLKVVP
jgi:type VI secretion system protein VasD